MQHIKIQKTKYTIFERQLDFDYQKQKQESLLKQADKLDNHLYQKLVCNNIALTQNQPTPIKIFDEKYMSEINQKQTRKARIEAQNKLQLASLNYDDYFVEQKKPNTPSRQPRINISQNEVTLFIQVQFQQINLIRGQPIPEKLNLNNFQADYQTFKKDVLNLSPQKSIQDIIKWFNKQKNHDNLQIFQQKQELQKLQLNKINPQCMSQRALSSNTRGDIDDQCQKFFARQKVKKQISQDNSIQLNQFMIRQKSLDTLSQLEVLNYKDKIGNLAQEQHQLEKQNIELSKKIQDSQDYITSHVSIKQSKYDLSKLNKKLQNFGYKQDFKTKQNFFQSSQHEKNNKLDKYQQYEKLCSVLTQKLTIIQSKQKNIAFRNCLRSAAISVQKSIETLNHNKDYQNLKLILNEKASKQQSQKSESQRQSRKTSLRDQQIHFEPSETVSSRNSNKFIQDLSQTIKNSLRKNSNVQAKNTQVQLELAKGESKFSNVNYSCKDVAQSLELQKRQNKLHKPSYDNYVDLHCHDDLTPFKNRHNSSDLQSPVE